MTFESRTPVIIFYIRKVSRVQVLQFVSLHVIIREKMGNGKLCRVMIRYIAIDVWLYMYVPEVH